MKSLVLKLGFALALVLALNIVAVQLSVTKPTTYSRAIGDFTMVATAQAASPSPKVPSTTARTAALQAFQRFSDPQPIGLQESSRAFQSGLSLLRDSKTGNKVFTSRKAFDAWVFEFTGPPQGKFKRLTGVAVVNSTTGNVVMVSLISVP
jgi:hypothetical protein